MAPADVTSGFDTPDGTSRASAGHRHAVGENDRERASIMHEERESQKQRDSREHDVQQRVLRPAPIKTAIEGLQEENSSSEQARAGGRHCVELLSDVLAQQEARPTTQLSSMRVQPAQLLVPKSPLIGASLHGGVARSCAVGGGAGLTTAAVYGQLEARDMILDLSDLSYGDCNGAEPELIGKGSMGVLYSAVLRARSGAQHAVAVKHSLLSECGSSGPAVGVEVLRSMLMGAKIQAHPNIVEFVGAVMHNTHGPLLVYERIDGVNLDYYYQRMQQSVARKIWRPKLDAALNWCSQVFAALDWLHAGDYAIMHRDVKPSNLMLLHGNERVKLIDFGLSREVPDQCDRELSREPHAPARDDLTSKTGTYRYMAPEVYMARPGAIYGPMADIYSGTMTAHFIVTGELAFDRMPPPLIAERAALLGERPSMQLIEKKHCELADDLVPLFEAGWAASAGDRPTAREMRDGLRHVRSRAIDEASRKSKTLKGQVKGLFSSIKRNLSSSKHPSVHGHPSPPAETKLSRKLLAASMATLATPQHLSRLPSDMSDAGGGGGDQERGSIIARTRSDAGEGGGGWLAPLQLPSRLTTLTL